LASWAGANQPLGATRSFVSNLVDYGMNVQAAVEAPRFTVEGGQVNCNILIESAALSLTCSRHCVAKATT